MRVWILLIVFSISTSAAAKCDFVTGSFIEEMADPSYIKSINVEVAKSSKFARNAIKIFSSKSRNIPPKLKKKFRSAIRVEYIFGSCLYRAKIRQHGDWKDHIALIDGNPLQSLDVKLLDGNILKATKFKLLIPKTRKGRNEILATLILKELDFIAPETFEVNVNINGVKSIMLFQEKSEKELLERRLRREGPIFEGDERLIWSYKEYQNFELEPLALARLVNNKWFDKGSSSQKIVLDAFNQLQKSYLDYAYSNFRGENSMIFPNFKKNKKFINYQNVLLAMNGLHALRPHNQKFFFNSIEGYFEPIYYDGMISFKPPEDSFFIEKKSKSLPHLASSDFISSALKLTFSDTLRKDFLKRTTIDFSSDDLSNDVFYTQGMSQLRKNLIELNNLAKLKNENVLKLKSKPQNYSWYLDFQSKNKVNQNLITQVNMEKLRSRLRLIDGTSIVVSTTELSKILSKNNLNGERYIILPQAINHDAKYDVRDLKFGNKLIRVSENMDVRFHKKKKQIEFIQSHPKAWALILGGDYSNWNLVFSGMQSNNLFPNPEEQRFNFFGLTGCLTLYKTIINDTKISVSKGECEDSVNFIRTVGHEVSVDVSDAFSDAVDADFSQIILSDLEVSNAGNDCIDFSGGKYFLTKAKLSNCKDKAISVGEMSNFQGDNIFIDKANIGVSSKDFSRTKINILNLNEVAVCGESKRKKQEFGGAKLTIKVNNCDNLFEQDDESLYSKDDV